MILHAHVETIPPDNWGTRETQVREVTAEAPTYDEGMAALRAQFDQGERLITVRVAEGMA
ncbi:hypothetical protein AAG589_20990 [Isoptericola sp. F-RaC21]|uniref:hypothetical protein n=1 Tax=Isoptericola sp. F-RaC21 TaxID=3141452 RepID=UPI00315C0EE6